LVNEDLAFTRLGTHDERKERNKANELKENQSNELKTTVIFKNYRENGREKRKDHKRGAVGSHQAKGVGAVPAVDSEGFEENFCSPDFSRFLLIQQRIADEDLPSRA
jgi:hypothetical protein